VSVSIPQPHRNERRIGWLPGALLTLAVIGGLVALVVAAVSLVEYCDDTPSPDCRSGSPGFELVSQAILALLGLPLVFAIGAALRRGRVQIALIFTGLAIVNYIAWGVLLDLGANGELTIL
jgi:hypothetical protein